MDTQYLIKILILLTIILLYVNYNKSIVLQEHLKLMHPSDIEIGINKDVEEENLRKSLVFAADPRIKLPGNVEIEGNLIVNKNMQTDTAKIGNYWHYAYPYVPNVYAIGREYQREGDTVKISPGMLMNPFSVNTRLVFPKNSTKPNSEHIHFGYITPVRF